MGLVSPKISTKKIMPICRQLATSYGAGIPILRSLELITEVEKHKKTREVFQHMHDDIQGGATLAQACLSQSERLPPLFTELLSSGEVGGRIETMLLDLAQYYEDRLAMRRTIIGKSLYPAFQLCMAWFLGSFALRIIPQITMGKTFNAWVYFGEYARFQALTLLLFFTGVAVVFLFGQTGTFRRIWGLFATYLWPLRNITRRFARARFFRSLALLVGSGLPIGYAIERAAASSLNPYVEKDLLTAVPRVAAGMTLTEAFAPCGLLTPQTREMIHIGEESGRLEESLQKAADYQMQEAVHAVDIATRVGEVLIIIAVAIVIAFIVFTFYDKFYGGLMDELNI